MCTKQGQNSARFLEFFAEFHVSSFSVPVRLWHILKGFLCPRILFSQLMYDIYFSLPYLVVSHISVCSPDGFHRLFRCSSRPFFPAHLLTRHLLFFSSCPVFFRSFRCLYSLSACHSLSADLPCPPGKPLIARSWPLSFTGCAFFLSDFAFFARRGSVSFHLFRSIPSGLLFSLPDRRTVIMTL